MRKGVSGALPVSAWRASPGRRGHEAWKRRRWALGEAPAYCEHLHCKHEYQELRRRVKRRSIVGVKLYCIMYHFIVRRWVKRPSCVGVAGAPICTPSTPTERRR